MVRGVESGARGVEEARSCGALLEAPKRGAVAVEGAPRGAVLRARERRFLSGRRRWGRARWGWIVLAEEAEDVAAHAWYRLVRRDDAARGAAELGGRVGADRKSCTALRDVRARRDGVVVLSAPSTARVGAARRPPKLRPAGARDDGAAVSRVTARSSAGLISRAVMGRLSMRARRWCGRRRARGLDDLGLGSHRDRSVTAPTSSPKSRRTVDDGERHVGLTVFLKLAASTVTSYSPGGRFVIW